MNWIPLASQRLDVDPSQLCQKGTLSNPQLAKDDNYARAIQEAWREEFQLRDRDACLSESTPITFKDTEGTPLYGHVVRRQGSSSSSSTLVPGIVLFHTAAGPHDVCLHWKADSLVTDTDTFYDGCVVLIADILSDDIGWGWNSDRSKYNQARAHVMKEDEDRVCRRLQSRIEAAINALVSIPGVDSNRLGAMGWCLGGRACLELARMQWPGVKVMVTFHGVFDGNFPASSSDASDDDEKCRVLICNGADDPFVSQEMLDAALATFQRHSCRARTTSFEGARHGFTNPAQYFNPNPAFGYNREAATQSWRDACSLLQDELAVASSTVESSK